MHSSLMWRLELEQRNGRYFTQMRKQKFGSHELQKMESNGAEFGVVPGQSDQEAQDEDLLEEEKTLNICAAANLELQE